MKNFKLLWYCLIFSGFLFFYSCNQEELTTTIENIEEIEQPEELAPSFSQEKRKTQPTILGNKKRIHFQLKI